MTNQNILLKFTAKTSLSFGAYFAKTAIIYATDGAIYVWMADDGEPTPFAGDAHTEKLSKYIDDWLEKESENQNLSPLMTFGNAVECLNCG